MRHSQSSQNFYSQKKVTINSQSLNANNSTQKDSQFKSTYAADFNNPSEKKDTRFKHRQSSTNLQNRGSMVSLKAAGSQSKQRFQEPIETEIFNSILNQPSQIPPGKLLQTRKTQHYYDHYKNHQNKYQSNYQSMTRLLQESSKAQQQQSKQNSATKNTPSKNYQSQNNSNHKKSSLIVGGNNNDPYDLEKFKTNQDTQKQIKKQGKTTLDKRRESVQVDKNSPLKIQSSPNKKQEIRRSVDKDVNKIIQKAEKQHQASEINIPYETGKQRSQLINNGQLYSTATSNGFYHQNHGSISIEQSNPTNKFLAQFTSTNMSQDATQSGMHRTGQHRITDRFVKYPYPNNIITNYKKDYNKGNGAGSENIKDVEHRKMAFNLEKEHKIINPHKMELKTTAKVDFKPFSVIPQTEKQPKAPQQNVPFIDGSIYKSEFMNWGESNQLIEKTPQYPVYQLPFKGQSIYQENYQNKNNSQTRNLIDTNHQQRPGSSSSGMLGRSQSHLKLGAFQPQKFDYETTKQKDYQPFKITQRPITSKPNVEPVKTHANPAHFQTLNKREFKAYENYKPPSVDFIPYP